MVKYLVSIKVDGENIEKIKLPDEWCFTIKQSNGEETRSPIFISRENQTELQNSRGTANFAIKWEGAKKQSTASIVDDKRVTEYISCETEEFQPIVCLECRGLDISECHVTKGLTVIPKDSEHVFRDVDVAAGDWFDYDDTIGQSVGINGFELQISRA